MVTKVGRSTKMLICSDCGTPRSQEVAPAGRTRAWLLTAVFLAVLGGSTLAITRLSDLTRPPQEARSQKGMESN
jgi:hypothetical protein